MKARLFTVLIILAIGLAGFTKPAQAQAYTTSFTTSITYQNVGTADTTTLQILFYAEGSSTAIIIDRPALAAGAGTSVSIGTLGTITPGFKGSAVMQADQPLLATLVQVPQSDGVVKVRPMSNGFAAGSSQTLIATVLKNMFTPPANTIFSVQNVDSENNNITINFYNTSATLVHSETFNDVAPGAAVYWDTGAATDPLPATFNGSAVVTAVRSGGGAGAIVSSAMELETTGKGAKAFEGVSQGATDFFMPSALCKFNSSGALQDTAYAVQNTDLTNATNVTVTYDNGVTDTKPIGPGAKASFVTCNAAGMTEGYKGAATIHSDTTPVIAVGKAFNGGLSTAFVGAAAGSGSEKVALPYVRYATAANYASGASNVLSQRSFITIQNIGGAPITGDITVSYVTCTGAIAATHTIPAPGGSLAVGAKVNSNAGLAGLTEFGLCGGGGPQYGGGALVQGPAGSALAVVVRVQQLDTLTGLYVGEDYNGINTP